MSDYTVQFLLMELESVGNIRLEEGGPAERWCRTLPVSTGSLARTGPARRCVCRVSDRFASCCNLLLSRFRPSDFKVHGVSGIKINRVVRINNTVLRLRFEDKFDSLRVGGDGPGQYVHTQKTGFFCLFVGGGGVNNDGRHGILNNVLLSNRNYRCQLEHLFYVSDPEENEEKEILRIIEEGFKVVEEHEVRTRLQFADNSYCT